MSLISQVLQEINDEDKRAGESQCFIGHEFRHKDLRVKLERALERLGLHAYFADKEVTGEFVLTKVCKKILVTRASIVDLSLANPNVYFELGMAIGLNKPVFIVLKHGASVPPLLENFVKLRFTYYARLEEDLATQVPGWLEQSIEHHLLYNTHCHFANVLCPDRQRITPQRRYLVVDQIEDTDETGQLILTHDQDLRAELPVALDRFHFTSVFLADVPLQDTFRLCDYCHTLRDSSFALCHLTRSTSPNVYLLLGLTTGLDIPSLLMVHNERGKEGQALFEIPTMLRGLDAFYYEHAVDIGERLADEVEGFLNRHKGKPTRGRVLLFSDLIRRCGVVDELSQETPPKDLEEPEPFSPSMRTVLIAEDSIEWANILKRWIDQVAEKYSLSIAVEMVLSEAEAIDQMRDRVFDLIITDMSPDLQLIRLVREINAQSSIIALKSDPSITAEQSREAVTKWQVSALLVKQTMDAEAFSEAVVKALGVDTPHRTVDAIKQHISRLTDLTAIFDTLAGLIGADAISIHQYDQKQGQFILPGHVVGLKYPFAEDRPTQDSPAGRIIQTRRPYFAEDAAVDQLVSSDLVKRESITSVAALPLLINNEAVGILFAYFRVLHRFKEREREFLVAVAELTANAIKDTRDRERKAEVHSALSAARDITDPKALAKAVIQAAQQFAELGDVASVRDALTLAQFITDPVQQTNALVIVVDTLAQLRDTRGLGSVIEIALTITIPDAQAQVLRAASRAFEKLGETEKAQHVASLITQAFTYDIFLSYSHSDSERVRNWLLPRLENAGLRVCIDFRDFEVGVPSLINVERAIERSRTTLLVLTREYIQSEWANLERSLAILLDTSTREQRVIPVLLGRTELPPLLRRLQFIDLSQPDEADAAFEQLISTIRGEKPGREYEQIRNPFVYSPVAARSFVDREIELQKVLSSVERGQSISIVGPRRIGKTSFLRTISQQLQLRENIVWLYIDLEMLSSEEQFYQILGSELERIVAQYSKRDQEWSVLTIDGILRSVARQKKIVLLMDEFDVVTQWYREGRFSDQFFGALRSWANSGQITMIVASVKNLFELSVGSQYASSFANIFLDIHLGKFDRDSARRLATLDGTVHFTDGEVDFIVDTTGGHPFYIQMLCSLLLDAKNANQGQADLQSVKEEFLERIKQFRDFEGEK